ncbi:hypothetical protein RJ55_04435 [Drechmeria coniospora]|nr:hypothetical protein RJ55_04435 [Drechmeria coniospora]
MGVSLPWAWCRPPYRPRPAGWWEERCAEPRGRERARRRYWLLLAAAVGGGGVDQLVRSCRAAPQRTRKSRGGNRAKTASPLSHAAPAWSSPTEHLSFVLVLVPMDAWNCPCTCVVRWTVGGGGQWAVEGSGRWRAVGGGGWRAVSGGGQWAVEDSGRWRTVNGGGQWTVEDSGRWRTVDGGEQ